MPTSLFKSKPLATGGIVNTDFKGGLLEPNICVVNIQAMSGEEARRYFATNKKYIAESLQKCLNQ